VGAAPILEQKKVTSSRTISPPHCLCSYTGRTIDDSDSASEWGGSAESEGDDQDYKDDDAPAKPRRKMAAASQRAFSAPKPRGQAPRKKIDEDDDDDDEKKEKDLSIYQHHNRQQIKQLQQLKKQLFKKLYKLAMPDNPLDKIINELGGPEQVAELTGRKVFTYDIDNIHARFIHRYR